MPTRLLIDHQSVADFCRRHKIRQLSLFGSVLREDFDPEQSDIDVLVEFTPVANRRLTYFRLARMQFELEDVVGHPVDLTLADSLDPYIRSEILDTAEIQYVAA